MRSLEEIRRRAHAELRINDSITVYEFIDPVEYRNQAYPPEFCRNWSYKSIGLKGITPW